MYSRRNISFLEKSIWRIFFIIIKKNKEHSIIKLITLIRETKNEDNMNNTKILLLSALLIINCSGTIPNVGNEVAVQETPDRGEEVVKQEVSVETFTIQEPESPPLPVTVFRTIHD